MNMLNLIKSKKSKEGRRKGKQQLAVTEATATTSTTQLSTSSAAAPKASATVTKASVPVTKASAASASGTTNSTRATPDSGEVTVTWSMERPPSRSERPPSRSERPSSRNSNPGSRSRQPRLGIGSVTPSPMSQPYLFDDDPGIMSEVETSSTRFRRATQERTTYPVRGSVALRRTSPAPPPFQEDDSGIMSEAETSSTAKVKRNAIPMGSLTLNRMGALPTGPKLQIVSTQGFQPVGIVHPHMHGVSSTMFEDDPGIMSEAETASTRRKGHRLLQQQIKLQQHRAAQAAQQQQQQQQGRHHALPIVRTPSKTLERPLGLVFLIYRGETKRALLPNEITTKDTIKALFVRSFGKPLTMEYLDSPRVRIYIHDSAKDIFYELEHLSDIRDRCILKLFEVDSSGRGPEGLGPTGLPPITNTEEFADQHPPTAVPIPVAVGADPEYVDSNYVRANKMLARAARGEASTLPRNAFSPQQLSMALQMVPTPATTKAAPPTLGERSKTLGPGFMRGHRLTNNTIASPDGTADYEVIGRSVSRFSSIPEDRYYKGPGSTEEAKARMLHMEQQLNHLTGMVEKALRNKKLAGKKQVSFDKNVSFSDEAPPPHIQPQSILSTAKRSNHAPAAGHTHSATHMAPATYNNLRGLQKSARELRQEVRVLRRLTQLQSMAMKDLVQDTYLKLREACIAFSSNSGVMASAEDLEHWRIAQDEELFSRELTELLQNVGQLESKVEEMRSGVINKKNKILLQDVESMALLLSKSSKTVTQLKKAFPTLEANLRGSNQVGTHTMDDFLKKAPERLETCWRKCKKLTGTLVTLKRLASVQEQRFHPGTAIDVSLSPTPTVSASEMSRLPAGVAEVAAAKESSLDDLLDALQNYTRDANSHTKRATPPAEQPKEKPKMSRQNTAPSVMIETTTAAPPAPPAPPAKPVAVVSTVKPTPPPPLKDRVPPPCPPRSKGAPPPPPPRTSSTISKPIMNNNNKLSRSDESSSSESVNSQEGVSSNQGLKKAHSVTGPPVPTKPDMKSLHAQKGRQDALEQRHQELLARQKQLQEQYQRLQQMQKATKIGSVEIKTLPSGNSPLHGAGNSQTLPLPSKSKNGSPPAQVSKEEGSASAEETSADSEANGKICETDIV